MEQGRDEPLFADRVAASDPLALRWIGWDVARLEEILADLSPRPRVS